jgi:hypothetical protein
MKLELGKKVDLGAGWYVIPTFAGGLMIGGPERPDYVDLSPEQFVKLRAICAEAEQDDDSAIKPGEPFGFFFIGDGDYELRATESSLALAECLFAEVDNPDEWRIRNLTWDGEQMTGHFDVVVSEVEGAIARAQGSPDAWVDHHHLVRVRS